MSGVQILSFGRSGSDIISLCLSFSSSICFWCLIRELTSTEKDIATQSMSPWLHHFIVKVEWKLHTAKFGDLYSEIVLCIYPSKVHTHTHTHTVNIHPEQWAAIYAAAPGEQLGVRCLDQGHLSCGIEERALYIHSPPPTIPAGPRFELATFRLQVQLSNH